MYSRVLSATFLVLPTLCGLGVAQELGRRQACASGYTQCSPPGASSTSVPSIGSGLAPLYVDLLDSIAGISVKKRELPDEIEELLRRALGLCCTRASGQGGAYLC